jgi:hypothetical protein
LPAAVDLATQEVDARKLIAPVLIRLLIGSRWFDITESGTHLKVVRVVDWTIDAQAGIPRKGRVARNTKHLVAAVHLGDVNATLRALFGVSSELLHGRNVVFSADVPSMLSILRMLGCF